MTSDNGWHEYKTLLLDDRRQNEEKFKSFQFDLSTTITGPTGKEVVLGKIIGGAKPNKSLTDLIPVLVRA